MPGNVITSGFTPGVSDSSGEPDWLWPAVFLTLVGFVSYALYKRGE